MFVKQYKKYKIEKTKDGVVEVVSPKGSRFVVGLDDSKTSGKRRFVNKCNNIKAAKKYIDSLTS